ncbi:hypothetical protein GPJ56_001091 [Histomonas meleagridis]|uniref:uncharacterized protein n=1 Tax=Histomonas meleagridis TaxID=135588 RepID=UPI003559F38C|nr:hypothetical protein GPJ56_001091 [Histomonas meleagridis]KAH0798451.1 hypothetical protein GO595_008721 [Histomonas meleagridis]
MKKTEQTPKKGTTGLVISLTQPPSIEPIVRTSQFPFESFGDSLHFPPPSLRFGYSTDNIWYSHVPMTIFLTVVNLRVQEIKELVLTLKIYQNKTKLLQVVEPVQGTVGSQCSFSHQFKTKIVEKNCSIKVKATCSYKVENMKFTSKASKIFEIQDSITVTYQSYNQPNPILNIEVQNKMPWSIQDVEFTAEKSTIPISSYLNTGEKASNHYALCNSIKNFTISWDLPFAKKNSFVVDADIPFNSNSIPIILRISNAPTDVPILKPFSAKVTITNIVKSALSGEMGFKQKTMAIEPFGVKNAVIEALQPGCNFEIDLSFVALKQGSANFPSFTFDFKGYQKFEITLKDIILVVGSAE